MTYVYQCQGCDTTREIDIPLGEDIPTHIECQCGDEARKVFTTPGIIFTGKGWACKE